MSKHIPKGEFSKIIHLYETGVPRKDIAAIYGVNVRAIDKNLRTLGVRPTRKRSAPDGVPDGMKWCPLCEEIKAVSEFSIHKNRKVGLAVYCRPCGRIKGEDQRMRKIYKITKEERDQLALSQGGLCAICSGPMEVIDHSHETGLVRGLLCKPCNSGLGFFRDNREYLLNAVEYLDKRE